MTEYLTLFSKQILVTPDITITESFLQLHYAGEPVVVPDKVEETKQETDFDWRNCRVVETCRAIYVL